MWLWLHWWQHSLRTWLKSFTGIEPHVRKQFGSEVPVQGTELLHCGYLLTTANCRRQRWPRPKIPNWRRPTFLGHPTSGLHACDDLHFVLLWRNKKECNARWKIAYSSTGEDNKFRTRRYWGGFQSAANVGSRWQDGSWSQASSLQILNQLCQLCLFSRVTFEIPCCGNCGDESPHLRSTVLVLSCCITFRGNTCARQIIVRCEPRLTLPAGFEELGLSQFSDSVSTILSFREGHVDYVKW